MAGKAKLKGQKLNFDFIIETSVRIQW